MTSPGGLLVGCLTLVFLSFPLAGQESQAGKIPSAQEVADLLNNEPITLGSWPAWKQRLLDWINDRSRQTDAAYDAARKFCLDQAGDSGNLPPQLAGDYLAWYFLGSGYLHRSGKQANPDRQEFLRAEASFRKCLELNRDFARGHRNLAAAIVFGERLFKGGGLRLAQAERELSEAKRLDPSLPLSGLDAQLALLQKRFGDAELLFRKALKEDPTNLALTFDLVETLFLNPQLGTNRAAEIKKLADRFPDNGVLACMHGLALAANQDFRSAHRELERARSLGTDPAKVLNPRMVEDIENRAAPSLIESFFWIMLYFVGFYAAVMGLMAVAGLVLAGRTRGAKALRLLQSSAEPIVSAGQVARVQGESGLAKLYALALMAGLVLFYLSIPFVIVGLLGSAGLLIYSFFLIGRIPVKLVAIIGIVGLGMAWAVFKSLFTRPASGSFGIRKTAEECPRLHQLLTEVAQSVGTDPVHEVYAAPGSAIGVHQEGRGPFGMFGVKNRVLTLGLSTMRFLTVGELKAILAHEYAHFSHRDTFYSRFIYQVHMSIEQALMGMGGAGGKFNYLNPFYWFLYLYYKCYSLLSAGFSRSREFLADRMASSLYGSDVFASALTKVSTDGTLFEMTIYQHISQLLEQQQAFVNMYESFRQFRDEQLGQQEREDMYQKLLHEKGSLFAQHPTFGERIEAVSQFPMADKLDSTPALQLFDNPEEIEKELTQFLTDYMAYLHQLQAEAEAAAAQG